MEADTRLAAGPSAPTTAEGPRHGVGWADSLARALANVLSPPVVTLGVLLLVASQTGAATAWRWAATFVVLGIVPPVFYVAWLVRRGHVTDIHLPLREERTRPFVATLASSGTALVVMAALGAPPLLVVVAAAGWLQVALLFAITLRWKISTHCAAAAALAALAVGLRGTPAVPLVAIVPVVAWSRLRLQRHDRAQVVAGGVLGAGVTLVLWKLLA